MQVCSTTHLYHYLLNPEEKLNESILSQGLRPLSHFPNSSRRQIIEAKLPGFFEKLYVNWCKSVVGKPYTNSGVFFSPIDFRLLPDSLLSNTARIRVPLDRLEPDWSCLTYEHKRNRISLPLNTANLESTASLWDERMILGWFAKNPNRLFYYVPQVVTYQPGGIQVHTKEIERQG